MSDLRGAIEEALELLKAATGASSDELFGDRIIDTAGRLPAPVERAAGIIEGAALALGLTALELLDQLELA